MFKNQAFLFIRKHLWIFIFLTLYLIIVGFKLIKFSQPFFDWDESLYVECGQEMVAKKYLLAPLWQDKIWLDKPPLSSLFFGIVSLLPIAPEISNRIFVLSVSALILFFVYLLYYRATDSKIIALLTAIGTSFAPIFLQRSQVVSLDIFLLLGWFGFFLFYKNFWASFFFLLLSVQSKSLLGFYPLAIYFLFLIYEYLNKKIKKTEFLKNIKNLFLIFCLLSLWYIIMLIVFKEKFWQAHIIETHFRRVSASLESHFGQRTYYIDLLRAELSVFQLPALFGFIAILWLWLKKKMNDQALLLSFAFVPWFIFLNLTKTKIAWYLYPVIPQFFFLAFYCLSFLKRIKIIQIITAFLAVIFIFSNGIFKNSLLTTFYSNNNDPHILISKFANINCNNLLVLVPENTRNTYQTLKKLNLVINSTNWWGEHPSMVYYFKKPLLFSYSAERFRKELSNFQCSIIDIKDSSLIKTKTKMIKQFGNYQLYKK